VPAGSSAGVPHHARRSRRDGERRQCGKRLSLPRAPSVDEATTGESEQLTRPVSEEKRRTASATKRRVAGLARLPSGRSHVAPGFGTGRAKGSRECAEQESPKRPGSITTAAAHQGPNPFLLKRF